MITAAATKDRTLAHDAFDDAMRWADIAHSRMVAALAPLFLVMAIGEDEPVDRLRSTGDVLRSHRRAGVWVNIDFAIRRTLIPLCKLERFDAVAELLGGLSAIPQATPDTENAIPRAEAIARGFLGGGFDERHRRGQHMSPEDVARTALTEIDSVLGPIS